MGRSVDGMADELVLVSAGKGESFRDYAAEESRRRPTVGAGVASGRARVSPIELGDDSLSK